ncbi:MAG: alpha/beta hydrolase [Candidatus Dormibacteraeota bacterium]|nr:alpha/beta hydrolase [Candidatus Dormibacteraeota bacterium]
MGAPLPTADSWGHSYAQGADGVRLHYVSQGKGETVLLLHGWPGFWYDWRHVIPLLGSSCRVVACDFRGFGLSDPAPEDASDRSSELDLAADTLALMDHLGVGSALLVGFDVGGAVAQTIARRWPERAGALVLLNPVYPGIGDRRFRPDMQAELWYQHFHRMLWSDSLIAASELTVRVYLDHFHRHWAGRLEALDADELEQVVQMYARPGAVRRSLAWYRSRLRDSRPGVPATAVDLTVRQPTYVLWGDMDPLLPVEFSDRLADTFQNLVRLQVLPGVGHFAPIEAPGNVAAAVLEMLSRAAPSRTVPQ